MSGWPQNLPQLPTTWKVLNISLFSYFEYHQIWLSILTDDCYMKLHYKIEKSTHTHTRTHKHIWIVTYEITLQNWKKHTHTHTHTKTHMDCHLWNNITKLKKTHTHTHKHKNTHGLSLYLYLKTLCHTQNIKTKYKTSSMFNANQKTC